MISVYFLFLFLLAFDFCRFCVVIRFFHPGHNGQWPPTSKDIYTRSYPLHCFLILFLEKEPVFPFSMFSAKQVNYWYHFYNDFGMTRSLSGDWTRDHQDSTNRLSRRRFSVCDSRQKDGVQLSMYSIRALFCKCVVAMKYRWTCICSMLCESPPLTWSYLKVY